MHFAKSNPRPQFRELPARPAAGTAVARRGRGLCRKDAQATRVPIGRSGAGARRGRGPCRKAALRGHVSALGGAAGAQHGGTRARVGLRGPGSAPGSAPREPRQLEAQPGLQETGNWLQTLNGMHACKLMSTINGQTIVDGQRIK